MAEVTIATANQVQSWSSEVTREYIRESSYLPYMGTEDTSIFRVRNELKTGSGDTINFPLIQRLKGRGVVGAEVLKGNEIDLGNANDAIKIDWFRQGVKVPKSTSFRTAFDVWAQVKPQLRSWSAEKMRDDISQTLGSIIIPGTVDNQGLPGTDTALYYALSTAGQRNTFLVNNNDRIVMGNAKSNTSSGVWATSLGNVSSSTGKATAGSVGLLKRAAKTAGQSTTQAFTTNITPFKSDMTNGREFFVWFVPTNVFRDLANDASIIAANTNARAREGNGMDKNPLFQDGDLLYQGVIIREVPELPVIAGAGAAGIDVAQTFFCGQSAVGIAYGMQPRVVTDMDEDYQFRPGMAIEELRGIKKTSFGGVQYGVVTGVFAATADA